MATNAPVGDVLVEEVSNEEDFLPIFHACAKAFGEQTADGIWTVMNPGWETEAGKTSGAARMASRWRSTRAHGHTHFLKASVITSDGKPRIVGTAIWIKASLVPGHGDAPDPLDFTDLYPNDPETAVFLSQILGSMQRYRRKVLEEKAEQSAQKSVMILDLCALDPDYQRRGIASRLVQWGLDEAQRLGIESITEASRMGRSVYKRLGFREVAEIKYELDNEFSNRSQPSNVFLRTMPA